MNKPDFLIIGASRSGTSSLHRSLEEHPELSGPNVGGNKKEVHFFDRKFERGAEWYFDLFKGNKYNFESTPNYLYHKKSPERISKTLPDCKFIIMLRNPINRAWSHFINWKARNNWSIEILKNPEHEVLKKGIYIEQLLRWSKYFRRDRFKIIRSEDFYGNPELIIKETYQWLGLKDGVHIKSIYYDPVNTKQSKPIKEKQAIPKEIRRWLKGFYKPYNEILYQFTKREMGWK